MKKTSDNQLSTRVDKNQVFEREVNSSIPTSIITPAPPKTNTNNNTKEFIFMESLQRNYNEQGSPRTATIPPTKSEERSIPSTQPTPPPSKSTGGKK